MRISKAFLAVAAFAVLALFAPRKASAFDCDRMVADEAGAFSRNDLARVEQAAAKLSDTGADVRVRTVLDFGGADTLPAYVASVEAACASWRAPDGGRKNNLIALVVSYGNRRDLGLWYGDQWSSKLDERWGPLLAEKMRPALRDGRDGDAFIGALDGTIGLVRHVPPAQNGGGPVVIDNREAADFTGLWYVLGGVVVIGLIVIVLLVLRSRKREREERQAARQRAQQAKANCMTLVTGEDPFVMAGACVSKASNWVSDGTVEALRTRLRSAETRKEEAVAAYAKLDGADSNPDREDLTAAVYGQIAASYDAVEKKFETAAAEARAIEKEAMAFEKVAAEVPGKIAAAKAAIETSKAAVQAVADLGYRVADAETFLKSAATSLTDAGTAKTEKRLTDATSNAAKAVETAGKATASAEALPIRRAAIVADHSALSARIKGADGKIDAAVVVFQEIAAGYAESCWQTVRGNGSEAEDCVLRADEQVRKVLIADEEKKTETGLAAMATQDWSGAETALAQAKRELDRANSLIQSIYALKENLAVAKRDARPEIDAARKDVTTAREFIAKHDDDIRDSLETDLDTASKRIDEAEAELGKAQPDYLFVLKTAKLANSRADDILVTARGEHEAAERERAKAESALRDATAAVSAAKEYLEDHDHELPLETANGLASAKKRLAAAENATTPAARIKEAEAASAEANAVLKTAQGIVERKRKEREEAERQERARLEAIRQQRLAEERRLKEAKEAADLAERLRRNRPTTPTIGIPSIPSVSRPSPAPRSGGGGGGSLGSIGRSRGGGGSLGGW